MFGDRALGSRLDQPSPRGMHRGGTQLLLLPAAGGHCAPAGRIWGRWVLGAAAAQVTVVAWLDGGQLGLWWRGRMTRRAKRPFERQMLVWEETQRGVCVVCVGEARSCGRVLCDGAARECLGYMRTPAGETVSLREPCVRRSVGAVCVHRSVGAMCPSVCGSRVTAAARRFPGAGRAGSAERSRRLSL